jgi:hypothetical protein
VEKGRCEAELTFRPFYIKVEFAIHNLHLFWFFHGRWIVSFLVAVIAMLGAMTLGLIVALTRQ